MCLYITFVLLSFDLFLKIHEAKHYPLYLCFITDWPSRTYISLSVISYIWLYFSTMYISCKTSNSPILYFPFWEVHISRHLSKTQSTGQIVFIFSFLKKSHLKGNFQHNDLTLFENVNIRAKWAESSRILEICQSWIWKHNLEDQNEQIGWRKISLKLLVKVDH